MKKVALFCGMLVLLFSGIVSAETNAVLDEPSTEQTLASEAEICAFLLTNSNLSGEELADEIARRGCCSHHKGVCGCGGSKLRCCDGTLSPSCRCSQPFQNEELMILETSGVVLES